MAYTTKQVELLARTIVNRLEDRGLVEFSDAEAGIEIVIRILTENFRGADAVASEVRERLARIDRRVSEAELEEIIRKVAAERGFVV